MFIWYFFIMNKKGILLLLACIGVAHAHQMPQGLVASLSVGPAWYQAGQTQTLYLQPNFDNTYAANKPVHVLGSGALFLGVRHSYNTHTQVEYGLEGAGSTNARLQGEIWEFADPLFNNFSYGYKVQHSYVGLKGRLFSDYFSAVYLPYLSGSAGIGFNRAYQFTMTPLLFQVVADPLFQSKCITSFSYTVGAGIQRVINKHWSMGLGYEWGDFGRSVLGPTPVQTVNQGLSLNHLYTNQLQFSLHYLV